MKIALTGASGDVGRAIAVEAVFQGHQVVGIDRVAPTADRNCENLCFVKADTSDYAALSRAVEGCDALIHMAAIPGPGNHPGHVIHNNNVVGSYNALFAAAEQGIRRICLASSVNAIGLAFSRAGRFHYFPIDEDHPNYCEDPYSLSKWICEQQADSIARRHEDIRIASMRFHLTVRERSDAARVFTAENVQGFKQLWAYTRFDAAARACLLSLNADFNGHEVFNIVAPDTTVEVSSRELAARYFPDVPIRSDLEGHNSFFNSTKAERLLGWKHTSSQPELVRQSS